MYNPLTACGPAPPHPSLLGRIHGRAGHGVRAYRIPARAGAGSEGEAVRARRALVMGALGKLAGRENREILRPGSAVAAKVVAPAPRSFVGRAAL